MDEVEVKRETCDRLLALAEQLGGRDELECHRPLNDEDLATRVALWVKAVHTYRAILVVADLELPSPVQVLSRSLIEAVMAQDFLCRHSIRLWRLNDSGKRASVDLFGKKLTRHFRTSLYLAHGRIQDRKWLTAVGPMGERKEYKTLCEFIDAECDEYEHVVGPEWMQRLRKTNSYTGLQIRELALCLGGDFPGWYDVLYRSQSRSAHASDPVLHVAWAGENHLTAPQSDFQPAIECATMVFLKAVSNFRKVFKLTEEQGRELVGIYEELLATGADPMNEDDLQG